MEFARNKCGLDGAHSTEIEPETKHPVVTILKEQEELIRKKQYGGSMRLGAWTAVLKPGSTISKAYGNRAEVSERHRHRYEVNPEYISALEKAGLVIAGKSKEGGLVEYIELAGHPYFVATQSHPEFKSRPEQAAPLFVGLARAAVERRSRQ